MPSYNGVNHLAMVTADMDMTIRFWRDLLGMRLVVGLGRKGYRHYFFEISKTDMIAFFEWPNVEKIPDKDHGVPVTGPAAFDHVSIGVDTIDDLVEIKGRLAAAGQWVSEIIDHGFIHSIYAFDPNHIPIEFSYNVSGIDVRATPRMKDRHPSSVTLEGANPQPGHWPQSLDTAQEQDYAIYPGEGRILTED